MKSTVESKPCGYCGTLFRRPPSQGHIQYCSLTCWYAFAKGKGLTGPITKAQTTCAFCGVTFVARPSKAVRRFCSIQCLGKGRGPCDARKKPRVSLTCEQCGAAFTRLACQIGDGLIRGRFCSPTCRAYHSNSVQGTRRTSPIELRFFDECRSRGADLTQQVMVGPYCIDAVSGNTAFEFDGGYWHSLQRVVENDRRKDLFLKERGFRVVRIPEKVYKTTPDIAVGMVLEACQHA